MFDDICWGNRQNYKYMPTRSDLRFFYMQSTHNADNDHSEQINVWLRQYIVFTKLWFCFLQGTQPDHVFLPLLQVSRVLQVRASQ